MNKVRLQQLADHLRTLPHKLWDYRHYVMKQTDCGTVGCALGHCPDLWPNDWVISPYGNLTCPTIDDNEFTMANKLAAIWFDIPRQLASSIFSDASTYNSEWSDMWGPDFEKVTKEMVADKIDSLVKEYVDA